MAYTYTWLRNGSVVSGQTSSTYSFSPLLVVHSGQYSCRVSVGSTSMTSGTVTIAAVFPPLTVMIVSSGGALRTGQNHILTCEAGGGGSMAYTYMWLRNGSVVSGQTSSTYSFSPLLVVHSGQYFCQVSDGSMNVTSENVNITVERTATQLYFTLRGNRYEPGDSILITDIGVHHGDAGPGDSLVCVTTDVNTQCCTDEGGVGEWFLPDGSMVIRNINDPNRNNPILRTGRANQVRLNFRTRQTSPTGEYTCVVPETGGSVIQTAGIRLVTELPQLSAVLTGSGGTLTEGQNHVLTCTASGGGSMAYTYTWLRNGNVVSGQTSSTYSFSPLLAVHSGQYSCRVSVGSMTVTSEGVDITVENSYSPRSPESVTVTSTTPTGVTIQWMLTEPFNATRPETFVVLYGTTQNRLTRTSTSVIATATSQTYSIQLNSLDIGTQYYFQVQSRNRFESVVINVMNFTTDDTVSGPVTDLQTNSPDDFTLVIFWRPPTTPNGNILSYTITIENLKDGTTLQDIVNPSAVTTSLTENGLVPGVPYHVSVVAVNRAGQGNITTLTNFTKELEPTHAPKDINVDRIHSRIMVVSWTPLTPSEARGFITSYTVFYSPQVSRTKRQESNTMQKTVSGDVNRTIIDGLDPNTAYDVQMSANTKVGTSSFSEVISAPVPPNTGDGCGLLIAVIVVALVVVLVLILIIILLLLLVLRMQRTVKARNKELVELRTPDQSDTYEVIDKEQDKKRNKTFSEIKSPSNTNTTNSQSKVEELALSPCPAYVPVNSPSVPEGEEDAEDKKNGVYETINST